MTKLLNLEDSTNPSYEVAETTEPLDITYGSVEASPLGEAPAKALDIACQATDSLERVTTIVANNQDSIENSELAMEMLNLTLESIYSKVGISKTNIVSLESHKDLKVALEQEEKGFFAKVWEAIKKFFSNVWNWIKGFLGFNSDKNAKTQEKVAKLKAGSVPLSKAQDFLLNASVEEMEAKVKAAVNKHLGEVKVPFAKPGSKTKAKTKSGKDIIKSSSKDQVAQEDDADNTAYIKSLLAILQGKEPLLLVTSEYQTLFGNKNIKIHLKDSTENIAGTKFTNYLENQFFNATKKLNIDDLSSVTDEVIANIPDSTLEDVIDPIDIDGIKLDVGGNLFKFIYPEDSIEIEVTGNGREVYTSIDSLKAFSLRAKQAQDEMLNNINTSMKSFNDYIAKVKVDLNNPDPDVAAQAKEIKKKINVINALVRFAVQTANADTKNIDNLVKFHENYLGTVHYMLGQIVKV